MGLTPEQRGDLLAKAKAATQGEWSQSFAGDGWGFIVDMAHWGIHAGSYDVIDAEGPCACQEDSDQEKRDTEYIVAACNAVPDLIAALDAAEARIAEMEAQVEGWREGSMLPFDAAFSAEPKGQS